jgi:hypothetical protein
MKPRIAISLSLVVVAQACSNTPKNSSVPSTKPNDIGFPSVREALVGLRARGLQFAEVKPGGWIITQESNDVHWAFTARDHPAFPSVVLRTFSVNSEGELHIDMRYLCEAEKVACEKLFREFTDANERIYQTAREMLQESRRK